MLLQVCVGFISCTNERSEITVAFITVTIDGFNQMVPTVRWAYGSPAEFHPNTWKNSSSFPPSSHLVLTTSGLARVSLQILRCSECWTRPAVGYCYAAALVSFVQKYKSPNIERNKCPLQLFFVYFTCISMILSH